MKLGRKLHFSSVSARNLIPQFFNPQLFPSWYVRFILGTINPQAIDIALKNSGVIYYVVKTRIATYNVSANYNLNGRKVLL